MNVYLMRHPAREGADGICLGQCDLNLSAEGFASLPLLAKKAAGLNADRILSSDLNRCQILAEEIAALRSLSVELNPAWRELSFGDWEGRPWDDLRRDYKAEVENWFEHFVEVAPPKGESFQQLQDRVLAALRRLDSGYNYLIVTHAGVIRSLISAFSEVPLRKAFEFPVPYGGITHLSLVDHKWSLHRMEEA